MTCGKTPPDWRPGHCCDGHLGTDCCRVRYTEEEQRQLSEKQIGGLKRDAGLGRALLQDPIWATKALEAIKKRAESEQPFTADDIRADVGKPAVSGAMGAAIAAAQAQGLIRRTGDQASAVASRRRGRHGVWIGAGAPVQGHLHEEAT